MNDEALNMSIRKFLKTVGVNSQLAIEKAVTQAVDGGKLAVGVGRDKKFLILGLLPRQCAALKVCLGSLDAMEV